MAKSEIVPNRHIFVSNFGGEIEKKVEKYSKNGYCSSINVRLECIENFMPNTLILLVC